MKEIKAIVQPFVLDKVIDALHRLPDLPETTVSQTKIYGAGRLRFEPAVKMKIEIVVPDDRVDEVVDAIRVHAHTGNPGDGGIFVIPVEDAVAIRTGESRKSDGAD